MLPGLVSRAHRILKFPYGKSADSAHHSELGTSVHQSKSEPTIKTFPPPAPETQPVTRGAIAAQSSQASCNVDYARCGNEGHTKVELLQLAVITDTGEQSSTEAEQRMGFSRAGNGIRTRDPQLGKLMLYP